MNQQKQTRSFSKFRRLLSLSFGIWISIIIGVGVFNEYEPDGNSDEEIKKLRQQISVLVVKMDKGQKVTWSQIDDFGYEIDYVNREIAIAMFMDIVGLSEPPKTLKSLHSIWENRVELSQKKWKMYKLSGLYIKSVLAGAGSLILTIPGVWFVLGWMILILGWVIFINQFLWRWIMMIIRSIWDFFLDRIAELSNAIRGKKETRSS